MSGASAWREEAHYAHLLAADRTIFAWEWLRRNPAYQAAMEAHEDPSQWGLHGWLDPDVVAPAARPIWIASDARQLVRCHALQAPRGEALDLASLSPLLSIECCALGEHALISDGLRAIRLDILSGTINRGPVILRYELSGIASAQMALLPLRRFLAIARTGSFSRMLHRPERMAVRWLRELRAFDALSEGATQREIASVLLARNVAEPGWRLRSPSIRLQAQRLVRRARYMAGAGYRDLLEPCGP